MVGIVEEQHPDRTRLFMQWKQMSWPVLVDSLNLLEVTAVPITVLIDEGGTVRGINPSEEEFERFLEAEPETGPIVSPPQASARSALPPWPGTGDSTELIEYANAHFLWDKKQGIAEAIRGYSRLVEKNPSDGIAHFRLGVCYRCLFEMTAKPEDFRLSIRHWSRALEIDPNQYIWRRRIQQWGPRLDKPYSFYDWVHQARDAISGRGEIPVELTVEPTGAELAYPIAEMVSGGEDETDPDPMGRIWRDPGSLIQIESVVVPTTSHERKAFRVHLMMTPVRDRKAHWNNEAGDLKVWLDFPAGWTGPRLHTFAVPSDPVSQELREVEFEVMADDEHSGPVQVPGYALYYVCEDVTGTCLYRRQDLQITIE